MCGRYALRTSLPELARILGVESPPEADSGPRYNIAPTQNVPVAYEDEHGKRRLHAMRWGLVPAWSKGIDTRYAMFNARMEEIEKKPAFRSPIRRQRCLVPADGWYEWRKENGGKQPYFLHLPYHGPFLFAGVWECWRPDSGDPVFSCSILTTAADGPPAQVHARMPVIAPGDLANEWLSRRQTSPADLLAALAPAAQAAAVCVEPVSRYVNNARNEGPECVVPTSTD